MSLVSTHSQKLVAKTFQCFSERVVNYLKGAAAARNNWQILLTILSVPPSLGMGISLSILQQNCSWPKSSKFPSEQVQAQHHFKIGVVTIFQVSVTPYQGGIYVVLILIWVVPSHVRVQCHPHHAAQRERFWFGKCVKPWTSAALDKPKEGDNKWGWKQVWWVDLSKKWIK